MNRHKFKKGDTVVLTEDCQSDGFFVVRQSIGKVARYDNCLVVVSMPHYVTICPQEKALELVSTAGESSEVKLRTLKGNAFND